MIFHSIMYQKNSHHLPSAILSCTSHHTIHSSSCTITIFPSYYFHIIGWTSSQKVYSHQSFYYLVVYHKTFWSSIFHIAIRIIYFSSILSSTVQQFYHKLHLISSNYIIMVWYLSHIFVIYLSHHRESWNCSVKER